MSDVKMRPLWSKEPCEQCGSEGSASRTNDVPADKPYICDGCSQYDRGWEAGSAHERAGHQSAVDQWNKAEAALATARAEAAGLRAAAAAVCACDPVCRWCGESADDGPCQAGSWRSCTEHPAYTALRALLASPEARDAGEGGGCDGNG
jgi:hypothetical protein